MTGKQTEDIKSLINQKPHTLNNKSFNNRRAPSLSATGEAKSDNSETYWYLKNCVEYMTYTDSEIKGKERADMPNSCRLLSLEECSPHEVNFHLSIKVNIFSIISHPNSLLGIWYFLFSLNTCVFFYFPVFCDFILKYLPPNFFSGRCSFIQNFFHKINYPLSYKSIVICIAYIYNFHIKMVIFMIIFSTKYF